MKKFLFVIVLLLLFTPAIASARSGCCSHHGGVCGCGCCDGTGLSATCAPYYPECNSRPIPAPTPAATTSGTSKPDFNAIVSDYEKGTLNKVVSTPAKTTPAPVESSGSEDYSWLEWVVGIGAIGVAGYFIGKNKK